jgi:hypothetical protein
VPAASPLLLLQDPWWHPYLLLLLLFLPLHDALGHQQVQQQPCGGLHQGRKHSPAAQEPSQQAQPQQHCWMGELVQ